MKSSLISLLALATGGAHAATCSVKAFSRGAPKVFGVEILKIEADEVKNWNQYATSVPAIPALPAEFKAIDFCNVTVLYTHPGLNDTIRVNVWLPLDEREWNNRFLGQGGGGWAAGNEGALAAGVALGFAAANTDSGHTFLGEDVFKTALDSSWWAVTSPGNVNLHALQNFGYRALDEMTWIAKGITEKYYKSKIDYSYWNGCSTGGRQGLVLAQRYPSLYQGIIAAAPAINWVTFLVTEYYAHVKMQELQYFPPPCELNAITAAAIEACDELDGVKDGVVSAAHLCKFDAKTVVGQTFSCDGEDRTITKEAAQIAQSVWSGPIKDGKPVWYGLTHETAMPGYDPLFTGLAATKCEKGNKNCRSYPFPISADWIRNFILRDPSYDLTHVNEELFYHILRTSRQQYHSLMDSADPDLNHFKQAGGKLITWHGLTDQLIPPGGTSNYYERVANATSEINSFYRHFEVPGVAHCFGGMGAFPGTALNSLIDWVEKGRAPDQLDGESLPAPGMDPKDFASVKRPLCPYPKVAAYQGGDASKASSFRCEDGFGTVRAKHDEL